MALDEERFFYRTGRRASTTLRPVTEAALRPALFAQVSDLTSLRYDFPVVLVSRPGDDTWIEPLSALVDVTLAEVAPAGSAGERFRRTVLRLEREIRILLAEDAQARGTGGRSDDALASLEDLWNRAQARLTIAGGDPAAAEIQRARAALQARDLFGGLVADCDAGLPSHLVAHAWSWVEARKADRMRQKISTLLLTLGNLVRADYMRSEAGRGAETLAAGVGGAHRGMFDFGVMAQLLAAPSGASALPATRRARIDGTIEALSEQQFFGPSAFTHRFDRVAAALAAWRERQPAMAFRHQQRRRVPQAGVVIDPHGGQAHVRIHIAVDHGGRAAAGEPLLHPAIGHDGNPAGLGMIADEPRHESSGVVAGETRSLHDFEGQVRFCTERAQPVHELHDVGRHRVDLLRAEEANLRRGGARRRRPLGSAEHFITLPWIQAQLLARDELVQRPPQRRPADIQQGNQATLARQPVGPPAVSDLAA